MCSIRLNPEFKTECGSARTLKRGGRSSHLLIEHWKVAQIPIVEKPLDPETVHRLRRENTQRFVSQVLISGRETDERNANESKQRISSSHEKNQFVGQRFRHLFAQHWNVKKDEDETKFLDYHVLRFNGPPAFDPEGDSSEPIDLDSQFKTDRQGFGTRAEALFVEHWRPVQLCVNGIDRYKHTFYPHRVDPPKRDPLDWMDPCSLADFGISCCHANAPMRIFDAAPTDRLVVASPRFLHLFRTHWAPATAEAATEQAGPPVRRGRASVTPSADPPAVSAADAAPLAGAGEPNPGPQPPGGADGFCAPSPTPSPPSAVADSAHSMEGAVGNEPETARRIDGEPAGRCSVEQPAGHDAADDSDVGKGIRVAVAGAASLQPAAAGAGAGRV